MRNLTLKNFSAAYIEQDVEWLSQETTSALKYWNFADSPLEGAGFEPSVPRETSSDFEVSAELGPIDLRRAGIIRAAVGLSKR